MAVVSNLIERLRENAEHHKEIAHSCDCRPEDTANWQHAMDDIAAADHISELEAALEKIIEMNVQYCIDRYGDASQADGMGCVVTAREALNRK